MANALATTAPEASQLATAAGGGKLAKAEAPELPEQRWLLVLRVPNPTP